MKLAEALSELQSLDLQNPGAWPHWARVLAAVIVAVLVGLAGVWMMVRPVLTEIEEARAQEQALRQEFETKQAKAVALDAYREQLAQMERSFGAMLRQLPSKAEVANLLNDISQARVVAGLEEELFEPQAEETKDFYAAIPNKIIVTGSYHQIADFVSAVAALPRIVTIEDVEIRLADDKAPARPEPLLRMTAIARTYRYLDDSELAEQAAQNEKAAKGARR